MIWVDLDRDSYMILVPTDIRTRDFLLAIVQYDIRGSRNWYYVLIYATLDIVREYYWGSLGYLYQYYTFKLYYYLRVYCSFKNLSWLKSFLTHEAVATMVYVFVKSLIDYYKSSFYCNLIIISIAFCEFRML